MLLTRIVLTLTMVTMCLQPAWAGLQEGHDALLGGDKEQALKEWRPLAEQGNAEAQFLMGAMYDEGQGVPQDYEESVRWYKLAAAQGHASAQGNLGIMYDKGQGVCRITTKRYVGIVLPPSRAVLPLNSTYV